MSPHADAHVAPNAGPKPRRIAVFIPIVVLLAIVGVLGWSVWPMLAPTREVRVAQAVFDRVAFEPPSTTDEEQPNPPDVPTVQAPGWLEAEPFYVAATALADGVVDTVNALEGQRVERGQIVATMIAEDSEIRLRRAEAELTAAQAALATARAERAAAQRNWDEPVQLERAAAAGAAALDEAQAELDRLPSLIASARATLRRLEEASTRVARSVERGATNELEGIIAEQRAVAQRAEVDALEAQRAVLEARVARLRADLKAAQRDLELRIEDRRRLDTATAGVTRAKAAVQTARASRDEAALELERMVIRAPITGYVQERLRVPGDKLVRMADDRESAHILHIYDPERLRVRVDVPLADASHVFVGQRCEVVVEVLPDRVFAGEVLRTTHEADLQKNTLEIHVKVIDPEPVLRPEMLTRVKFLPPEREPGAADEPREGDARVLVPVGAVEERSGAARVWLVTQRRSGRGVVEPRSVTVVSAQDGWATVTGDLRPGALVAMGAEGLRTGERVTLRGGDDSGGAP